MAERDVKYLRVKCPVCKQCWCIKGEYRCIYGGPYHGYIRVRDDSGHTEQA
jgi:hypothetical protein